MAKRRQVNLVSKIPEEKQKEIALDVITDHDSDWDSLTGWREKRDGWYKLWLCHREAKSEPWPGASNVCLPILASASSQFHARSYQSIFAPPGMVKTIPVAENDYKRSKNVEEYMNWQTMYEMEEYEDVFDRLLQLLPINGMAFKKLHYDKTLDRAVSEYISALDLILPYGTKTIETARRISHRIWLHYDQMMDRDESGIWENFDQIKNEQPQKRDESELKDTADKVAGQEPGTSPKKDLPHLTLEQHRKYDLGDGKRKPYIFTVNYDNTTLVRAVSRDFKVGATTKTMNYFIDYNFIPNPEGFYSFGFGHFLEPLIEMANTAFNQIFDSGKMTNMPFGFYGRRAGIKEKKIKLKPGLMTEVNDAKQVYFPNLQRVDQILFQVLGLIQQHIEQFTSTSDYLSGRESRGTKTPTAHGTLAIIEQGLVTFAVMTKRIFRSLRKELRLLMALNQLYLPDTKEYRIMGEEDKIAFPDIKKDDFGGVKDVIPIGDPSYASKLTRRQEAQELYQMLLQNPLIIGNPETGEGRNDRVIHEATSDLLDAYDKKNKSKLLPDLPDEVISPEMENAGFMQGDKKDPVMGENHKEHLQVHGEFAQSEFYVATPEEYKPLLADHINKTNAMMYQEQQMQKQAGQLQAGGR